MLTAEEKIKAICNERNGLRQETIFMQGSIHKTVFVFYSVCIAFASIYFSEKIISNPQAKNLLLISLAQAEFFAWLFVICLVSNQNVHVGYIRALEKQINLLNESPLSIWDSYISKRFIHSPKSTFFRVRLLFVFSLSSYSLLA